MNNSNGLKTIEIKGKPYVEVAQRIKYFRQHYHGYKLTSEIIELDDKVCVIMARVIDPSGVVVANGLGREVAGTTYINKESYVENCETSAWGRALGNFGIGIDASVASFEEVEGKDEIPNPETDVTAIVEQEFFNFTTEWKDECPEGHEYDMQAFKDQLWAIFKKQSEVKRVDFDWTDKKAISELVKKIKPDKIVKELQKA